MKKLNRKGFTLVELLAVIIILAIVVGISIPAVLTTTKNAKLKSFQAAADSAADWFDRQYQVATTGLNDTGLATLDANFTAACGTDGKDCTGFGRLFDPKHTDSDFAHDSKNIIIAAGLKLENIEDMFVYIDDNTGRTCVELTAAEDGDYYGVVPGEVIDGKTVGANIMKSSNCQ